ncbi:methyl-accepting chemotaxis protein [Lacimicrobium alkaliphilum]|uniref:Histidine kinase n=1 Tax=Lacimicrobium alkaliphilum TaxID=1526571 RepID=A0ABQ1QZD3_9ALTE|nr:methyl-accepting chemotaxis protein [Lacimicrobium alkaliphilum]GGD51052.1 histidine kinase [Lacimicrobium alkaliphilum]
MNLVQKLMAAFGFIVLVMIILTISVSVSLSGMRAATDMTNHTMQVMNDADDIVKHLLSIDSGQRGYVITNNKDFLQPYNEGKAGVEKNLKSLRQLVSESPGQLKRLDEVKAMYEEWLENAIDPAIQLRAIGLEQASNFVARGEGKARMEKLQGVLDEFIATEQGILTQRTEDAADASVTTQVAAILGGILVILVAVGAAWLFSRQLKRRLDMAMQVTTDVADGKLDTRIDDSGNDEIAELLSAMNHMQTQLRQMMQQIGTASTELNDASQSVSSTAEQLSVSSDEQSNSSDSIAASIQELSESIRHVSENAQEASSIATESGSSAEQSAQIMEKMVAAMKRINDVVRDASSQVVELGKQSEQISSIVNVIKSIADQTNLLALNAAIEAARAGEQGRGFSVVADEVRTLAQRTSESTDEIETMVGRIQQGTQGTVQQMERGVKEVEEGVELADQTGIAIREIRESFDRVLNVVQDISHALSEQNQASDEVAKHVERFSAMTEQNKEATQHTSSTAHQLQTLAGQLGKAVSRFRY